MTTAAIMHRGPIDADWAGKIWAVLVEECECRDDPRNKRSFVNYLAEEHGFGHEWRFQGGLGFGGKFHNDHFSWRCTCYSEHKTPARLAMIERANMRLAALRGEYIEEIFPRAFLPPT